MTFLLLGTMYSLICRVFRYAKYSLLFWFIVQFVVDNFSFSMFSLRKNFLLTLPLHQFLLKISSLKILTLFWRNQMEMKDHLRVPTYHTSWKQRQFSLQVLWKRRNEEERNANRTVRRKIRLLLLQKIPWMWTWALMMTRGPSQWGKALGLGGLLVQVPGVSACYRKSAGEVRSCGIFFSFCNCTKFAIRHPALVLKYHWKQTGSVSFHTVIFQKLSKATQEGSELVTCPWVSRYKHQEYLPTQWVFVLGISPVPEEL